MSSESLPAKKPKSRAIVKVNDHGELPSESVGLRLFDVLLIVGFLALTFLLGLFPLKDTDFWWHLRTGDLIRQTGVVPKTDLYTYSSEGHPWIDLHWTFQVAISWLYERGGVPALTLAKSAITCLAVLILVTARRREWPVWAVLLGWMPAILVLSGRNYVRPETFTLLYLTCFLAILTRIDRAPKLAFLLPIVQVAWVNVQGLFVFGPILLAIALIDAAMRPGAFAKSRSNWWRQIGIATALTGFACLINPYGLTGALYPLQIAKTMANPIFSNTIAELTPIPAFIRKDGFASLPLRLHLFTMAIGAASFVVPMIWVVFTNLRPLPTTDRSNNDPDAKPVNEKKKAKKRARKAETEPVASPWRLSMFRLLLYFTFSVLSLQATRNSHQFAAVVGAVSSWNFAEWAFAARRRAWLKSNGTIEPGRGIVPRLVTLGTIAAVFVWVGSGEYYKAAREMRTIGIDEQPLWYPKDAVKFSATPGMPEKFLAFHIGHPSLYDYYFGPKKKSFVDARLEVIGVDNFQKYIDLQPLIGGKFTTNSEFIPPDERAWSRALDEIGRPSVLADHENAYLISGSMLASRDWRCVWFDPVAAVFVHASNAEVVDRYSVDFGARHFGSDPGNGSVSPNEETSLALAKGLNFVASSVAKFSLDKARPMILLGLKTARRFNSFAGDAPDGWKLIAQFISLREPPEPVVRFRQPFDPVFDLSSARVTFALQKALLASPKDFLSLILLSELYRSRGMPEAALPIAERLGTVNPINALQTEKLESYKSVEAGIRAELGSKPSLRWENLSQLGELVNGLLAAGRAESAAECLERARPVEARTWEDADKIATLRLHLGEPAKARAIWQSVSAPPREAVRLARVAVTYFVEDRTGEARANYTAALAREPVLFEALYGLAVLEQDDGHAREALDAARKAEKVATSDSARSALRSIIATVTPYATSAIADQKRPK